MKILAGMFLMMLTIALAIPGDNGTGESYPTLALFAFIGSAWLLGTSTSEDEDGYWTIVSWVVIIGFVMGVFELGVDIVNWLME